MSRRLQLGDLLAIAALVLVAGCATPARVEQMATTGPESSRIVVPEGLRANIAIRDVTGGKETNPLWTSNVGSADFEKALEASLGASGMLAPNRVSGRYVLIAHIENMEIPYVGIDMTVTATVLYMLAERASGKTVFTRTVSKAYTAKFADAILGFERLKLANEGAMRVNIQQFLEELSAANLAEASSVVVAIRPASADSGVRP